MEMRAGVCLIKPYDQRNYCLEHRDRPSGTKLGQGSGETPVNAVSVRPMEGVNAHYVRTRPDDAF